MIPITQKTNIIISTNITDYSNGENLFFAIEFPRILETVVDDDTVMLVFISDDGIYMRILGEHNTQKTMTLLTAIIEKILNERNKYEALYGMHITPEYLLGKIVFE